MHRDDLGQLTRVRVHLRRTGYMFFQESRQLQSTTVTGTGLFREVEGKGETDQCFLRIQLSICCQCRRLSVQHSHAALRVGLHDLRMKVAQSFVERFSLYLLMDDGTSIEILTFRSSPFARA